MSDCKTALIAWLISGVGIFAGFHLNKLRTIEAQRKAAVAESDRAAIATKLAATTAELEQSKAQTAEVASRLARFTVARQFTDPQRTTLRQALTAGPRGKVIITFLQVERDAAAYANQFAQLLTEAGFEVTVSDRIWVNLAHDGLWICIREVPPHAPTIEAAFKAAGIELQSFVGSAMHERISAPDDSIVFVVSNRK
ncbi:MAG: hypothetical protein KDN22_32690 [Verrucomicrobiae bacterium]|nr:hypothetical protein [Verrucomicrobiae bacterium]